MNKLNKNNILFYSLTAAFGGFLFGFDVAIIAGAMPFFQSYFQLSTIQLGLVNSALLFGCIIGSVIAGRSTDAYGRKSNLFVVAVLFIITSLGCAIAPTVYFLVISRFLGGIAVGAVSIASPMYIAEITPANSRGKMMTTYQLSITAGILISLLFNYLLKDLDHNWRLMFASGILPSIIFLGLLFRIPESPRFLVKKGLSDKAFKVLLKIGDESYAKQVIQDIEASFDNHQEKLSDLWQPGIRRAVFIGFILAILVQASGIAAIIDYAPRILQKSGMGIDLAFLYTIGIGVVNFVFTIVSIISIDRVGRKPLYIIGSVGLLIASIVLSLLFTSSVPATTIIFITCLIYIVFFASCIGPVFWTLVPEMLPNKIRGLALTVPVLTQWFVNAMVVMFFPVVFDKIPAISFVFMAVMAALQIFFTLKYVPETKNKSLEEIELFWKR